MIVVILIIACLIVFIGGLLKVKRADDEQYLENLRNSYMNANYALGMERSYDVYMDYSFVSEKRLIINLAAYKYYNPEAEIVVDDIQDFLSNEFNYNGEPCVLDPPKNISEYLTWYCGDGEELVQNYYACISAYVFKNATDYKDEWVEGIEAERLYQLIDEFNAFLRGEN